jgi:hypothetical protein
MSVFVWYCGGVDEMRGGPSIVDDIIICSECGRLAPDQNGCRWVLESQSVDWCALFLKYGGHARDCVLHYHRVKLIENCDCGFAQALQKAREVRE